MKLTPLDIKKQEFRRVLRGYDAIEVDAFLDMVADEFEIIIRQKNRYTDEILKLKTQLQDYQQVERSLKDTLVAAQENINSSRMSTKREASLILREAELHAEKMIDAAKYQLEKMKNDISALKTQKDVYAKRFRHLVESQIDFINALERDDEVDDFYFENNGSTARSQLKAGQSGRVKVEIPVGRELQSTPENGQNRGQADSRSNLGRSGASDAKLQKNEKKLPRISDQFIT